MSLLWLVLDWRRRLIRLRAQQHGRSLAGTFATPELWLAAIRIRILSFLVARYAPMAERPSSSPIAGVRAPPAPPLAFCAVTDPSGPPPRPPQRIRRILLDIRRCNARPSRRWRWWI